MTDSDIDALRTWATALQPVGSVQAAQVLDLLAERELREARDERLRAALAPLHEFLRRCELSRTAFTRGTDRDPAPDTARIGIALVWTDGLTLGHLREVAQLNGVTT